MCPSFERFLRGGGEKRIGKKVRKIVDGEEGSEVGFAGLGETEVVGMAGRNKSARFSVV